MKLLITSDLHYNLRQLDWLLETAKYYDCVIIAGDLLNIAGYLDLELQITVISEYLRKLSRETKLLVCSGNHDGEARDRHGEFVAGWLHNLKSNSLLVDGQKLNTDRALITVCPWWDGEKTKLKMTRLLEDHSRSRQGLQWIWLHHAPPNGCRISWTGKRYGGDKYLNHLIERFAPDFVISGHIHTAPFYQAGGWIDRIGKCWVCNPGNQPGRIPTTIQLDLEKMTAVFDCCEGRESVNLNDPDESPFFPA